MHIPQKLKPGDAVAIVAPARKVTQEELAPAIALLHKWKLQPVLGDSIGLENHQFAGTDTQRAADFQTQLNNPKIKAIWCARGGYGSIRILDLLDFSSFIKNPKWIIGYSDITVFHAHINKLGIATLHAEMPMLLKGKSPETLSSLKDTLFGRPINYSWKSTSLGRPGKAQGILVGGNISVLYSLCGSNSVPNLSGKILFLEDLDEYLYHIDRMLQNLKRNGWFDELSGLLVGGLSNMHDNRIPFGKTAEEIICEIVKPYSFPVSFDCPAGHVHDNRALLLGQTATLQVSSTESKLTFV